MTKDKFYPYDKSPDAVYYPYNHMKHPYCPRDEFEFVHWGWSVWDLPSEEYLAKCVEVHQA